MKVTEEQCNFCVEYTIALNLAKGFLTVGYAASRRAPFLICELLDELGERS